MFSINTLSVLQIAGLVCKLCDNTTVGKQFSVLAQVSTSITNDQTSLVCQVPTRWNLDKACIDSHVDLQPVIESMISNTANKLSAFKLTEDQWKLAIELKDVLLVCEHAI